MMQNEPIDATLGIAGHETKVTVEQIDTLYKYVAENGVPISQWAEASISGPFDPAALPDYIREFIEQPTSDTISIPVSEAFAAELAEAIKTAWIREAIRQRLAEQTAKTQTRKERRSRRRT
jgi:hypothetical protein